MTNTEFPADQGESRDYIALERKVADLANALASGGSRFVTGDLIPHWTSTREGAVLCDGTIYLDTDPLVGDALAAMLRAGGFFTDATHVQVPDYTGRVLGGVGGSLGALGSPSGVATVTLTAAESGLPAHGHAAPTITIGNEAAHTHSGTTSTQSANHTHNSGISSAAGANVNSFIPPNNAIGSGFNWTSSVESANHTHTITTGAGTSHTHSGSSSVIANNSAAAASSAHTNIQPTLPAYIFIKT